MATSDFLKINAGLSFYKTAGLLRNNIFYRLISFAKCEKAVNLIMNFSSVCVFCMPADPAEMDKAIA